jgi:hypothetical protein
MIAEHHQPLPVVRVGEITREEDIHRWLIEPLWGASAVGVIGGAPKCAKTWLALDMALSVATGTPCLNQYTVPEPGPVLVYLAEDALPIVRERVEGMVRCRQLEIGGVPIHVITTPVLRLDRGPHRRQLLETVRHLRPRLLILDPLVRLHGIDENNAEEVAALLAYFRSLQRELDVSVVLEHHTRKNAVGGVAAGQGLRGSGDIHAFGDSNLYLRRSGEGLLLLPQVPPQGGPVRPLGRRQRDAHPRGHHRPVSPARHRNPLAVSLVTSWHPPTLLLHQQGTEKRPSALVSIAHTTIHTPAIIAISTPSFIVIALTT